MSGNEKVTELKHALPQSRRDAEKAQKQLEGRVGEVEGKIKELYDMLYKEGTQSRNLVLTPLMEMAKQMDKQTAQIKYLKGLNLVTTLALLCLGAAQILS